MRISDWSSDVCASDLGARHDVGGHAEMFIGVKMAGARDAALDLVEYEHQVALVANVAQRLEEGLRRGADTALALNRLDEETRTIDRKRVVLGKSVSVRVDQGGRRIIKKKKKR